MSKTFTRVEDESDHTHNAADNYYKTYRCEHCGGRAYTQWKNFTGLYGNKAGGHGNVIRVAHLTNCPLWLYLSAEHPGIYYEDWGHE